MTGKLDILKKEAAIKAVEFLQSGMTIGLGNGSAATYALEQIGNKIRAGELKSIIGIPSSNKTAVKLAQALQTRAGLVEHGLFPGLATDVIVGGRTWDTEH